MKALHPILLIALAFPLSGCQFVDKIWDYRYKEHHARFEKKVLHLQVKAMEMHAVADNLPKFQEEMNKVCSGVKPITIPKVAPFNEKELKKITLPAFYVEVPERLRRKDLTQRYFESQEKLVRLNHVVKLVEQFRRLKRHCTQQAKAK